MMVPQPVVRLGSEFLGDPVQFVATFWPQYSLASYQRQILYSLTTNTETGVHSANQMGKSFTAVLAAIWWFTAAKSKVVTLSTTNACKRASCGARSANWSAPLALGGRRVRFRLRRNRLGTALSG